MKPRSPPNILLLKTSYTYDKKTGHFIHNLTHRNAVKGKIAGHYGNDNEYVRIWVEGKAYAAHRLAWFYVYGTW